MMEQNQLLQLSMDPNLTPAWKEAVNNALNKEMLNTALAFGGADITKEQRAAWEAENAEYRAAQQKKGLAQHQLSPGTRVAMRPWGVRTGEPTSVYGPGKLQPPNEGDMAGGTGVIVTPGTPEAGMPAGVAVRHDPVTGKPSWDVKNANRPPSPHHVAVRGEQSGHWFWRHRDSLEVLPPKEEYPIGTKIEWNPPGWSRYRHRTFSGTVSEPPKSQLEHMPKGALWIEQDVGPDEPPRGGWLLPKDVLRKKK